MFGLCRSTDTLKPNCIHCRKLSDICVSTVRTWLGAICDWMDSRPPIIDHSETSFVTRVGPAELAVSSPSCPWLVRARRGQRLNLTVHFAPVTGDDSGTTKDRAGSPLCGLVVEVVDGNHTTTMKPPCRTDRHRQRQSYSSINSELKVYVRSTGAATYAAGEAAVAAAADDDDGILSSTKSAGFLLHYHGLLP